MNHLTLHFNYPTLTSRDIDVYYCLVDIITMSGKNCTPISASDLERITGISERTIRKSIHALVHEGLIRIEREGCPRWFSLPDGGCKPPKGGKKHRKKTTPTTEKKNTSSNILEFKDINTDTSSNISDVSEHDPFNDCRIRQLPPDKVEAVHRVWIQLSTWYGTHELRIGATTKGDKVAYMPEAVRRKMHELTVDQLISIIQRYDPERIQYHTAWIQAALMHPWSSRPYGQMHSAVAAESGSTCSAGAARCGQPQPLNRGHFKMERDYDIAAIEANLLGKPLAKEA